MPIILLNGRSIVDLMMEEEFGVRRRPLELYSRTCGRCWREVRNRKKKDKATARNHKAGHAAFSVHRLNRILGLFVQDARDPLLGIPSRSMPARSAALSSKRKPMTVLHELVQDIRQLGPTNYPQSTTDRTLVNDFEALALKCAD